MQVFTKKYLNDNDRKNIEKAIEEIDYTLQTEYDKDVANSLLHGASFHHAGLRESLRTKTENLFKSGAIKILASTPTLAAGVNLPAYRVIIHTVHRHSATGMQPISIKEYVQMSGRAGRLGYDTNGESILIARDEGDVDNLFERFVYAIPEDVESQLGYIPVLRTMLLSIISNEIVFNDESLEKFFNETFYAIRFGDINSLMHKIETILRELINFQFVKIESGVIKATEIGKRVSELYIDPLSAYNIISKLKKQDDLSDKEFLMLIVNTIELKPYFSVSKNKMQTLEESLQDEYRDLGLETSELWDDHEIIEKYYTMLILNDWVSEVSEQDLLNNYDILPGTLHNKLYNTSWVCYAIGEIAKILDKTIVHKKAVVMEKRIKQGVKDELLLLTELPNIGRARARKLHNNGYKTISEVKNCDPQILINILGLKIAQKILDHLKVEFDINTIFIKQESTEEKKILKKDESKATQKITKKKIKTQAKLQRNLFNY
jgi:helicase